MQSTRSLVFALTVALAAASSACSGGGGGGSSTIAFASSTGAIAEQGGTATVTLTLVTPGGPLGADASVLVSDSGNGSAQSGTDFVPFAPVQVVFPAGSAGGATATVSLTPLDDTSIEGNGETIVLVLSAPTGVELGAVAGTTLTLIDSLQAKFRFANPSDATSNEANAIHSTDVEILLPAGSTLDTTIAVTVTDSGTGTATQGADYAGVPPTTLTFPAGTTNGASQQVDMNVLDDTQAEGNETLRLVLGNPSPGTVLGGQAFYQLTITDDDLATGPFLYASEGPSGVENPLGQDAGVWLGTQTVGLGPNAGKLVRISNIGNASFSLGAPSLSGAHPDEFSIQVESSPLSSALAGELPPESDVAAPWVAGLEDPQEGAAFELDAALLSGLDLRPAVTLHGFPLPGRPAVTLALARLPLPFSDDARLLIDGVEQPGGPRALLEGLSLWSGSALEVPGSRVFLSFSPAGAQGFLELPDGPERLLHVVTQRASGAAGEPALVRVLQDGQLAALGVAPPDLCAGARSVPGAGGLPLPQDLLDSGEEPGTESLIIADCQLALETDFQLYQKFGSSPALLSYVTQLVAAVSERYQTDIQTSLSIAYLGVYTTAGDPWTSQDGGGDAGDLLDEFRDAWNLSGWPATADLAHFISGANLGGGIAYVGVLCNASFGYGVSGNVNGNINWGAWTGQSAAFTWDFVVVAHELGHNFGANHTHTYCPPLDHCASNCTNTTACEVGTLMSYCHICAGGLNNIVLEFHPVNANVMRTAVNSSCLGLSILTAGDYVQYLVRFNPQGAAGPRTANLEFVHSATNQPTPFRLLLSATAQ
jgi:hypothetical protein